MASADISAGLSDSGACQSLALCKAAKINAAGSVIAKPMSYLLLYLVARRYVKVLICSQRLVNTAEISD